MQCADERVTHSQIPLKLTLAPSEVVAVTAPPPVYVRK